MSRHQTAEQWAATMGAGHDPATCPLELCERCDAARCAAAFAWADRMQRGIADLGAGIEALDRKLKALEGATEEFRRKAADFGVTV